MEEILPGGRQLEFCVQGCTLGISARRIWEHTQLRQINPFPIITPARTSTPHDYVDIINVAGQLVTLTGLTLSDLYSGTHQGLSMSTVRHLLKRVEDIPAQQWLNSVEQLLRDFSEQRFVRNLPEQFLAADVTSPLGVQGVHCALATWLKSRSSEKATVDQWRRRIRNLTNGGLRTEEIELSHLEENLSEDIGKSIDSDAVLKCLNYKALKLSILPMVRKVDRHLTFLKVPANLTPKRVKPKATGGIATHPQWRDRALGYWVDVVDWDDLLGKQRGWMAFTHRGHPIVSQDKPSGLCTTHEDAWALANNHAQKVFPKLTAIGKWSDYRLTGGDQYREWLVTLPYYAPSYFSEHYYHRNILLHVRCDMREGADGERVLALQEVQSDWAQEARRVLQTAKDSPQSVAVPPWLKEWPVLALKLMLLHAASRGADALAWTKGNVQVERYNGLGRTGLLELYDHKLPSEMKRILRPYGKHCETVEVFQPVNFYIEPTDLGYEIRDQDGDVLGTAQTWAEAHTLLPDGAHEVLQPMHGVELDETLRHELLQNGFYAWGAGVQ